jgi:UDP-N-acetylmuramoylalanine--D-glutamate ligase
MKNRDCFKGKRVTVIGLARSGLACANLLHSLGADVSVTDSGKSAGIAENAKKLNSGIVCECGTHTKEFILGRDLAVLSPGIPDSALPVQWAVQEGIPVISEVEAAWLVCPCPVIAVTGSNGKTTTATLIGLVLNAGGKRAVVCGNIGNPFSGEVSALTNTDVVVLEISSFQLEKIRTFRPKIAVITNLNPNHLDRYASFDEYAQAKKRIYLNHDKTDYLVLNGSDGVSRDIAAHAPSQIVFFDREDGLNPNQAAVVRVADLWGVDRAVCRQVFAGFKGIEHRMEEVARFNGVTFINDSKATTVESAQWALSTLSAKSVLIAGGRHKGLDYRAVLDIARRKVKGVVVIGEAGPLIAAAFEGVIPVDRAADMRDAVRKAFDLAGAGENVLLSPMCSSYDMFRDYEERGRAFKSAVKELEAQTAV